MKGFMRAARLLEFDKVLSAVASLAATEGAREKLLLTEPSDDEVIVKRLTDETGDAKNMAVKKAAPPFGRVKNVLPSLERAKKGASLTPRELLEIASLLRTVESLRRYAGDPAETGSLEPYFSAMSENRFLEKKISSAIVSEEIIADDASDALYRIRREARRCESNVRDLLSSYTTGAKSKYLQENIVTMRGGRFVVPVKAEYKSEIKGLVHDTSASGATLFIEPIAVLEQNNRLKELKAAEAEEIERILGALSEETARFADSLTVNYNAVTDLAVIFARSAYSFALDATEASVSKANRSINLIKARHPLLPKETVVPITVRFGAPERTLIITGPNTGGKTVTLKTVGLMALMAQSGLHLPCAEGTCLPLFSCVLPDIGDEQSIEQSLSTFSAHMTSISEILHSCDSGSLTLFDELGAGTDPVEGAALAMSILEEVRAAGGLCVATTHYSELKIYALESPHVLNASCEFDVESLRPTYRLITGLPGKSNAFAISSRLGISDTIIDRAKAFMADDNKKLEDILGRLEESESKLEKERAAAAGARAEADEILAGARRKAEAVTAAAEKDAERLRENASRILRSAKASSDYVLDELRRAQAEKDRADAKKLLEETRSKVRQSLREADADIGAVEEEAGAVHGVAPDRPLKIGDRVIVSGLNRKGVIADISGKNAVVTAGNVRTKLPLDSLMLDDSPESKPAKRKSSGGESAGISDAVPMQIDLRGQTGDDAWFMTDRYLDSAIRAGYGEVTLVHGKGTGALRAALWRYLKGDKRVVSFRSGRYGEGDTGVTVCELRK